MTQVANLASTGNFPAARYTEYIQKELLDWGPFSFRFAEFMDPAKLESGHSITYKVIRKERLPIPLAAATESETPAAKTVTLDTVTGTSSQYVLVTEFSDVLEMVAFHDVLAYHVEVVKEAMGRLREKIASDSYVALTNVAYPNGNTTRAGLDDTDLISDTMISDMVTDLRTGDKIIGPATPWFGKNQDFAGIFHPKTEAILMRDALFQAAAVRGSNGQDGALVKGAIARWQGVQWFRCDFMPEYTNLTEGMASAALADDTAVNTSTGGLDGFKIKTLVSGTGYVEVTEYDVVVSRKHIYRGFEEGISTKLDYTSGGAAGACGLEATTPTDADGIYVYNVYIGSDAGTMYLTNVENVAGGVTTTLDALPTSGTTAPTAPGALGYDGLIIPFWIIGKDWGRNLTLDNLKSYITPRAASDSDPANQRRKVSAKLHMGSFVQRDEWAVRGEAAV